jgi:hypothetical protein
VTRVDPALANGHAPSANRNTVSRSSRSVGSFGSSPLARKAVRRPSPEGGERRRERGDCSSCSRRNASDRIEEPPGAPPSVSVPRVVGNSKATRRRSPARARGSLRGRRGGVFGSRGSGSAREAPPRGSKHRVVRRVSRHGLTSCAAAQNGCLLAGAPPAGGSPRGVRRHPARTSRLELPAASAVGRNRAHRGLRRVFASIVVRSVPSHRHSCRHVAPAEHEPARRRSGATPRRRGGSSGPADTE